MWGYDTSVAGSTSSSEKSALYSKFALFTSVGDLVFLSLLGVFLAFPDTAKAQQPGAAPSVMPGAVARDRNRQMDEYDRELDSLRNGKKVSTERRRNLFPQINEDFQRIQVIHNEMVRLIQGNNSLHYDRLMDLTAELKKRSNRLRTNLALPVAKDEEEVPTEHLASDDASLKESVVGLHRVIVSFVTSPLFKNLGLLDARDVSKTSGDLRDIIQMSGDIRKSAESLNKSGRK